MWHSDSINKERFLGHWQNVWSTWRASNMARNNSNVDAQIVSWESSKSGLIFIFIVDYKSLNI